jgi:hypothetical protein
MASEKPKAPAGLGMSGRALWRALCAKYVFAPREVAVLALAARQADMVAALEALLAAEGLVVTGAAGQPRLNAVVTELRQCRLALAKLLGELALPDEDQVPRTAASERGQRAARSRWANVEARRGNAPTG